MIRENCRSNCREAIENTFPDLPQSMVEKLAERLDRAYAIGLIAQSHMVAAKSPEDEVADLRKAAEYLRMASRCVEGERGGPRGGGFGAGLELQPFAYDALSAWGSVPGLAEYMPDGSELMARYHMMDGTEAIATVVGVLHWQADALDAAALAINADLGSVRLRMEAAGAIENGNKGKNVVAHTIADECCAIVAAVTGQTPTHGRNRITGEYPSTLSCFVAATFDALQIRAAPADVAKAARNRFRIRTGDGGMA